MQNEAVVGAVKRILQLGHSDGGVSATSCEDSKWLKGKLVCWLLVSKVTFSFSMASKIAPLGSWSLTRYAFCVWSDASIIAWALCCEPRKNTPRNFNSVSDDAMLVSLALARLWETPNKCQLLIWVKSTVSVEFTTGFSGVSAVAMVALPETNSPLMATTDNITKAKPAANKGKKYWRLNTA